MRVEFTNSPIVIDRFSRYFSTDEIKYEPMIFSGSWGFSHLKGGLITQYLLDRLDYLPDLMNLNPDLNIVIDTRVTMTFPGQYPSIPGWHCDDVPRADKYSQPDFSRTDSDVNHFLLIFSDNDDVSRTEFAIEPFSLKLSDENVYTDLDRQVRNFDQLKTYHVDQGELIKFSQRDVHRATPTKVAGWRYFIRISFTHRRPQNEIRRQVQVYTPVQGW